MENLLLTLLANLLNNDPRLKQTLREFCAFYRENREIFVALLNPTPTKPPEQPNPGPEKSAECPPEKDEEKDRPEETIHNVRVLEEFLRRSV